MMGLEPTTFCMASRRSSQLSYIRASDSFYPAATTGASSAYAPSTSWLARQRSPIQNARWLFASRMDTGSPPGQ